MKTAVKKLKNPLRRRCARELKDDWNKYLVIALFMIVMIGFVSGMYVANGSMEHAEQSRKTDNNLEYGHFVTEDNLDADTIKAIETGEKADIRQYYTDKVYREIDEDVAKAAEEELEERLTAMLGPMDSIATAEQKGELREQIRSSDEYKKAYDDAVAEARKEADKKIDEEYSKVADKYDLDEKFDPVPVKLYQDFYMDVSEASTDEADMKVRLYKVRNDINLPSILEGRLPESGNEVAVDRMHADNANIKIGDTLILGGIGYKVTGLVALVNYTTLYEDNTDMMFDALKFDVGLVTEDGWNRLDGKIIYSYSWLYRDAPSDDKEEKALADSFLKSLITQTAVADTEIEDYIPRYLNQAVTYAPNDMGADKAMGGVFLYVLIVVLSFVFAINIGNTINEEATVIGTLRASGYSRGELLRHYMTMPLIVTLVAAAVGNLLGYTVFKNMVVAMYYNSYSLPPYRTLWNFEALIRTTIIPVIIMVVVNLIIISHKLRIPVLSFLRNDMRKHNKTEKTRVNSGSFIARWRLRIFVQNIPGYITLTLGIAFVMVITAMVVSLPDTLKTYQNKAEELVPADYQTLLTDTSDDDGNEIGTSADDAEKFSRTSLLYVRGEHEENVTVYGVQRRSRYIDLPEMKDGECFVSKSFMAKFGVAEGDEITLSEKYEDTDYTLRIAGIYEGRGSDGNIAAYMANDAYNSLFAHDDGSFSGFLSNKEITDIDRKYIATTVTIDDVTKISRQLDHSMGQFMTYFQYMGIILAAVLIYLITKIIVDRNENAISMTKVLGYTDREISKLYITTTTFVVIVADISALAVGSYSMKRIWKMAMMRMEGWFPFEITTLAYVKMFIFVFIGYLIVTRIDMRRIKRIPMDQALKTIE